MFFTGWMAAVLLGIAAVFGYHLWRGWRTRAVRFPMSVLTLQEFELEQSTANYWGVMAADFIGLFAAASISIYIIWNSRPVSTLPIYNIQALNGCYEGEGTPDFMRPQIHWQMRIENGVISNRDGAIVSRLRLRQTSISKTTVAFSPGIVISSDERKISMVYHGNITSGEAYVSRDRPTIALKDDWPDILTKTNCE